VTTSACASRSQEKPATQPTAFTLHTLACTIDKEDMDAEGRARQFGPVMSGGAARPTKSAAGGLQSAQYFPNCACQPCPVEGASRLHRFTATVRGEPSASRFPSSFSLGTMHLPPVLQSPPAGTLSLLLP